MDGSIIKMEDRDIANTIWMKMKGIPIPDSYTDKDCLEIIYRYWHKAMERELP
jgi:hypothetical protein